MAQHFSKIFVTVSKMCHKNSSKFVGMVILSFKQKMPESQAKNQKDNILPNEVPNENLKEEEKYLLMKFESVIKVKGN